MVAYTKYVLQTFVKLNNIRKYNINSAISQYLY